MSMDKKNTKVSMSLFDYERLKECQKGHIDLVKEFKSILQIRNIQENSVEITIDKEILERFCLNFVLED
jgi:hemerythrin